MNQLNARSSTSPEVVIADMRADLARLASDAEASQAVAIILSSYPQRGPVDEGAAKVYVRQLRSLLAGYPLSVVRDLTSPQFGIPSRSEFLPTVAEVKKLADEWLLDKRDTISVAQREIASRDNTSAEPEISPEERARVSAGFDALCAQLREARGSRKRSYRPGESLTPEQNAALDAWINDPNTPDLPGRAKAIGSVAPGLSLKEEAA